MRNLEDLELYPIKLIDFDVSKQYYRDQEMWTRTGNVFYCAPEIFDGSGYNELIDCWAIGIILFQLLTGTLPFQEESTYDTI
jgi:serine/threonine protein kinase